MKRNHLLQFCWIVILSLVGFGIWQWEIIAQFGWEGLRWLNKRHLSIYPISALVVVAYMLPFSRRIKASGWYLTYPGMVLFLISIIGFHLAKTIIFILYARFSLIPWPQLFIALFVVIGFTAFCFHLITKRWIVPLKKSQIFVLILAITGTVPLSMFAVQWYNGPAAAHYVSFVDAVKAGWPFFWIIFLMGIAGLYSNHFLISTKPEEQDLSREDILDDQAFSRD